MNISIEDLEFFPTREIEYKKWFQSIQPNGITPTDEQRKEMVDIINERVGINSDGLRLFYDHRVEIHEDSSEYQKVSHIINTAIFFIFQTTSDCMVASKIYLLADKDYDKRYARGKLKVILNEGFKQLYGFPQSNKAVTYWGKLSTIIHCFPSLNHQFEKVDTILKEQSMCYSWWKRERDLEVHLEAINLYESRQEELDESKVMIETINLLDALGIVEQFVWNLHAELTNWINTQFLLHPEQFR